MNRGLVVAVGGAAIVVASLSGCSSDRQRNREHDERRRNRHPRRPAPDRQGKRVLRDPGWQRRHRHRRRRRQASAATLTSGDSPEVQTVGMGSSQRRRTRLHQGRRRRRGQGHEGRKQIRHHRQGHGHRHQEPAGSGHQALRDQGDLPVAAGSIICAQRRCLRGRRRLPPPDRLIACDRGFPAKVSPRGRGDRYAVLSHLRSRICRSSRGKAPHAEAAESAQSDDCGRGDRRRVRRPGRSRRGWTSARCW